MDTTVIISSVIVFMFIVFLLGRKIIVDTYGGKGAHGGGAFSGKDPSKVDRSARVVPAHSFKFAATLQENQQGANPVLIRVETDAGHGAGTPTSKSIALYADIFGFTLYNMGIKSLP